MSLALNTNVQQLRTEDGNRCSRNIEDMTEVFKALSDRTRMRIVWLLGGREYTVGELTSEFDLTQPSVSRHLAVLKAAALVDSRREGQYVVYRLRPDQLTRSMREFFGNFPRYRQQNPTLDRQLPVNRRRVPAGAQSIGVS